MEIGHSQTGDGKRSCKSVNGKKATKAHSLPGDESGREKKITDREALESTHQLKTAKREG